MERYEDTKREGGGGENTEFVVGASAVTSTNGVTMFNIITIIIATSPLSTQIIVSHAYATLRIPNCAGDLSAYFRHYDIKP